MHCLQGSRHTMVAALLEQTVSSNLHELREVNAAPQMDRRRQRQRRRWRRRRRRLWWRAQQVAVWSLRQRPGERASGAAGLVVAPDTQSCWRDNATQDEVRRVCARVQGECVGGNTFAGTALARERTCPNGARLMTALETRRGLGELGRPHRCETDVSGGTTT